MSFEASTEHLSVMAFRQHEVGSYDPSTLSTPSPSVSEGTVGSRQGAFSPPGIDRFHHKDLHVHGGFCRYTAHVSMDNQADSGTLDLKKNQFGHNMELDDDADRNLAQSFSRAAAHGPNAPRAP